MKFNNKELKILAIFIAIWGIFFLTSGTIMQKNSHIKTKINYELMIEKKQNSQSQAKKIEIELKDIETEINYPISVNVKDYIVDGDQIDENIIKQLELDTSLVNISESGTYLYTIKYNKKKYQAKIIVKEKELPDMKFTLKEITMYIGDSIPTNKKDYITEILPEEIYDNITLEIPTIDTSTQNDYKYYATYKNTKYEGTIKVREKVIQTFVKNKCPEESTYDEDTDSCICNNNTKIYDNDEKKCIEKTSK